MQESNDLSLIAQVTIFHNHKAFNALVVKYQSALRRFFLAQTGGDQALSDDLAQETFIKAYTHLHQFEGTSKFSTWLFRIGYNLFYDYNRRKHVTEDIADVRTKHPAVSETSMLRLDLQEAMGCLSENERICINLQLIQGQSIDNIATITGMASGTIKSHLSRGKQKLTTYLKKNGYEGSSK